MASSRASSAATLALSPPSTSRYITADTTEHRVDSVEPPVQHLVSDPGYLGFTSHCTVFEETRNSLSLLHGLRTCEPENCPAKAVGDIVFAHLPLLIREMSLIILRYLPGQPDEQMAFHECSGEIKDWTDVAVTCIIKSLQGTFGALLNGGDAGLEALAEIICNNTLRPLRDDYSGAEAWMDQFCGPNIRWESLGLLWAYLERLSDALDSLRTRRLDWVDGKQSPRIARTCLGYCIDLARHFNRGNDLMVDLYRRKAVIDSMIDGDAGKLTFRTIET